VWRTEFADGRSLIFAPKVYAYLDKSDNPDIQHYRGYADWNFRYGREDGWVLATQLRTGTRAWQRPARPVLAAAQTAFRPHRGLPALPAVQGIW